MACGVFGGFAVLLSIPLALHPPESAVLLVLCIRWAGTGQGARGASRETAWRAELRGGVGTWCSRQLVCPGCISAGSSTEALLACGLKDVPGS